MKHFQSKIRIKDIATIAGVSVGTVDRVLHNRGEVSTKSREAVSKALEEMNYTPNLLARSLATKKNYRFVCLVPAHNKGDYWESVEKGFQKAAIEFSHYNVMIQHVNFNQFDNQSLIDATEAVLLDLPDAVIIAPIFRNETISFVKKLEEFNIPYSFIDSLIDDSEFTTYYGQNSFQSGYLAAKLLVSSLSEGSEVVIIRTNRKGSESNQTIARKNGFYQYLNDNFLIDKFKIISLELTSDDEAINHDKFNELFNDHKDIKALITFNSKVYQLGTHLEAMQKTDIRLIGYDLLEQNISYLKSGIISILLAQRPEKQAYLSIKDICRKLIFNQEVTKINYMPIDILIKENIEAYMHFIE